ncbi:MAG: SDR family oxidoreductase [Butyrivibrio sp.]|nr:SDR family oxidoreductase [Butyrivibrio sp.]
MQNRLLTGKNAVITGCNRGIGLAILKTFVQHGARVYAMIRKENPDFEADCRELTAQTGTEITVVYADFADPDAVKRAGKEILGYKEPIDVLVHNVGIGPPVRMFTMTDMAGIRQTFEVNLFSAVGLSQLLCRNMMRNKQGSIIFLSSAAAYDGGMSLEYNSSKAAVIGAMRSMAVQLGQYQIRVNAIAPGFIGTEMGDSMDPHLQEITLNRCIMKRQGQPEEIADAALFLASDLSRFMTGQVLRVDGGIL